MRKKSQNWFEFSTGENSETLESSAINDGRSMLEMFLTVLYKVEGLETETFKVGFSLLCVPPFPLCLNFSLLTIKSSSLIDSNHGEKL